MITELVSEFVELVLQLIIGLFAVVACAMSHYRILHYLQKLITKFSFGAFGLIILFCGITMSQLLSALWFTFAFQGSVLIGLGSISSGTLNNFIELFYFSLINLTTLGLGQIEVTEHLTFLAGIEAMTGFLLVSCSASVLIRYMKH